MKMHTQTDPSPLTELNNVRPQKLEAPKYPEVSLCPLRGLLRGAELLQYLVRRLVYQVFSMTTSFPISFSRLLPVGVCSFSTCGCRQRMGFPTSHSTMDCSSSSVSMTITFFICLLEPRGGLMFIIISLLWEQCDQNQHQPPPGYAQYERTLVMGVFGGRPEP